MKKLWNKIKETQVPYEVLISLVLLMTLGLIFTPSLPTPEPVEDIEVVEIVELELVTVPDIDYKEMECLAMNIYHESRSDNMAGRYAVADVTLNRVASTTYPNTICEVTRQAKLSEWHLERGMEVPVRHKCQFSWFCDGKEDTPLDNDSWQDALLISKVTMKNGEYRGITEGATHYHATYVLPKWSKGRNMHLVGRIGAHVFYRQD